MQEKPWPSLEVQRSHEQCIFPGCVLRFDPELVAPPGPRNDPPGYSGWYQPQFVTESEAQASDMVAGHEHSLTEVILG